MRQMKTKVQTKIIKPTCAFAFLDEFRFLFHCHDPEEMKIKIQ